MVGTGLKTRKLSLIGGALRRIVPTEMQRDEAMTDNNTPDTLIEAADLVTEMTMIKHPFREQGIKAQIGVEF